MNRYTLASVSLLLGWAACSDEEEAVVDASTLDGSSGTADADPVSAADARPDLALIPDANSPDAMVDAAAPDASIPVSNVVFATFNGILVRIDPDTAALTEVAPLKNPANMAQTFADVAMAYTGQGNTALMVIGFTASRLATVDLCTATVTPGATLSRAASPQLVVEGIARHPNGTWYVSSGNAATFLTPNLSTLDVTTGVIASLGGTASTGQNDIDTMFFKGSSLYGVDVSTNIDRFDLFTLNLTTGLVEDMKTQTQADETLRVAYDESRDKGFGWRSGDRNLLEVDLQTGIATARGQTHAANRFGNAPIRGFFVAPRANCP